MRYRNRAHYEPQCDKLYSVMYPLKENSDYTVDENRNSRRINLMSDKYDIMKTVNGDVFKR